MKKNAFTLIELLIVVSIIGILSAIGLIVYSGTQSKARDSLRKNNLQQLSLALEGYFQKYGKFPPPGGSGIDVCTRDTDKFYKEIAPFMKDAQVPKDPKDNTSYCYVAVDRGNSYRLFAKVENCSDEKVITGLDCSQLTYKYSVTSDNLTVVPALDDIVTTTSPPPPTPTNLVATTISEWEIDLSWSGSPGVQYTVYGCEGTNCLTGGIPEISNLSATNYKATGLNCNNIFGFNVVADNAFETSPASTTVYARTLACPVSTAHCQDGSDDQTNYNGSMTGCNTGGDSSDANAGTFSHAADLCASGSHVCSINEYLTRGGKTTVATGNRWLSTMVNTSFSCDSLSCNGTNSCFAFSSDASNTYALITTSIQNAYGNNCTEAQNNIGYFNWTSSNRITDPNNPNRYHGTMCCSN